jgi:hypothetical protein
MKRALLAAVIGGAIALFSGAMSAQAAPIAVPKAAEAGTSLAQKAGYYRRGHRHYRRHHWRRPVVRWHRHYRAPRRWVRPHYRHHRHWTHRYHRRHYH